MSIATGVRRAATSIRSCTCRSTWPSRSSSAIDQPPGIRAEYDRIRIARGDDHPALHAVLECLGEVLWTAQRHGTAPDAALYLACLARQK